MDSLVHQVQLGHLDQQVLPALKVIRDKVVNLASLEGLVLRVLQDKLGLLDHKDHQDFLALLVELVHKGNQEIREIRAH